MIVSRNSSIADSYFQLVRDGRVFVANATVTSPVGYGTAAGMGGPLLWNNSGNAQSGNNGVIAVILGLSLGWTTSPAAAGQAGLTFGTQGSTAPTSTTAIDNIANISVAGKTSQCSLYRVGTVAQAGRAFLPTHVVSTGGGTGPVFVPLDGLVQVMPGGYCAFAGSAALTTMVSNVGLVWAEIPLS